jgi:alpha,alpha-trehalose-phosphate synthase [UDP-forming]/trehalose-phosphatase
VQPVDITFASLEPARWRQLARHSTLALLVDVDGTLVPFAPTLEQAVLDEDVAATLRRLADAGVHVALVSGRPRAAMESLVERLPGAWMFAEHGAWRHLGDVWQGPPTSDAELDAIEGVLAGLAADVAGARLERKSHSVCFHWRMVASADRAALITTVELVVDEWLEAHSDYERLPGVEIVEVRRRTAHKGVAVDFARERIDDLRIIAIGDDVTDEDMFAALGDRDLAISVGARCRQGLAQANLAGPSEVHAFLRWLSEVRAGDETGAPPLAPVVEIRPSQQRRSLVVISNRTPAVSRDRRREVGGLVSALEPAIRDRDGIWLGWSGQVRERTSPLTIDPSGTPVRACFDLSTAWRDKFYAGFCNRVLWPLCHGFPSHVSYRDDEWEAYVTANRAYARHALELAQPDATIWVHDYHLLLVARELRQLGFRGRIGLFLHTPYPAPDLIETIPWRDQVLEALLAHDLLGFHTARWAEHFVDSVREFPHAIVGEARDRIRYQGRTTQVGVFPIAIDAAPFKARNEKAPDVAGLRSVLGERRMLLGVDRLDYSKGIPERLLGFERLLERFPRWHGQVTFVQVSVPSRSDIPEYAELRHRVETLVGRINGRFGEADWVPVRYLYRSYEPSVLAQLYRLADVALVTPLRDGMNLVAKEFVAAQDPETPGVLVLSKFAGAAAELDAAILTNPYHADGLAADIDHALRLPSAARRDHHARLLAAVRRTTPESWAGSFLQRLAAPASPEWQTTAPLAPLRTPRLPD